VEMEIVLCCVVVLILVEVGVANDIIRHNRFQ
jgi:hypothetical protein